MRSDKIFWGNPAVLRILFYQCLTLCQKSKKSLVRLPRSQSTTLAGHSVALGICSTEVENSTLIPRAINQERSMILTCGFRGKFDKALDFHFQ